MQTSREGFVQLLSAIIQLQFSVIAVLLGGFSSALGQVSLRFDETCMIPSGHEKDTTAGEIRPNTRTMDSPGEVLAELERQDPL